MNKGGDPPPHTQHKKTHKVFLPILVRIPILMCIPGYPSNPRYPCAILATRAQSRLPVRNPSNPCAIPATRAQSQLPVRSPGYPRNPSYPRNHGRKPKGCQVIMG